MIPIHEGNTYFPGIRSSDYLFLLRRQYEKAYLALSISFETEKEGISSRDGKEGKEKNNKSNKKYFSNNSSNVSPFNFCINKSFPSFQINPSNNKMYDNNQTADLLILSFLIYIPGFDNTIVITVKMWRIFSKI